MRWVLRLVEMGDVSEVRSVDVIEIAGPHDLDDIANLGLTLAEAKQLLAAVQRELVAGQVKGHSLRKPSCDVCGGVCCVKDYRDRRIATLFGQVAFRLPRYQCGTCGHVVAGVGWPPYCRSTPELDQLRAHLASVMTYRVAAAVLQQILPIDAGRSPETLRHHTLKLGQHLLDGSAPQPEAAAAEEVVTVSMDSTFIQSCEDGERHMEVRIGNVETVSGSRQVFASVAKSDTDVVTLLDRNLEAIGRTNGTRLVAFTDGCPGLRSILAAAGVADPPILDWFHIAMRLQPLRQIASGLPADDPAQVDAKTVIVDEIERLRWRVWNGKAKDARKSIDRIRKVMHIYRGAQGPRGSVAPSRKLWAALLEFHGYLVGQSEWLVNYAERHRAGQRVGTAITEGTANFLVNRRMNKSQQMRWTRRGADLLLQVRCAVYNGTLGSAFGQKFRLVGTSQPEMLLAA